MKKMIFLGVLALTLGATAARADDDCQGPNCKPPTKDVCFNLLCNYECGDHDGNHEKSCTVSSTFVKAVTLDGGEVEDNSESPNNPTLELSCDGKVLFNNSAYRYTEGLGTRIQGQEGPTPAITLPRGELHSTSVGQGGGHYSPSTLEFQSSEGFEKLRGSCFIWAGYP